MIGGVIDPPDEAVASTPAAILGEKPERTIAGIVIGPVVMIVIVTTISVYLWVYKGVPMEMGTEALEDEPDKPSRLRELIARARARRHTPTVPVAPVAAAPVADNGPEPGA